MLHVIEITHYPSAIAFLLVYIHYKSCVCNFFDCKINISCKEYLRLKYSFLRSSSQKWKMNFKCVDVSIVCFIILLIHYLHAIPYLRSLVNNLETGRRIEWKPSD